MKFINSAVLNKMKCTASRCHSVLTKRCAFRRRPNVAVDSVDRRSSAGKLFQVSGRETAKILQPVAVAVHCTSSLPEAADRRCRHPVRWTTAQQSSARYGGARPCRQLLISIAILYLLGEWKPLQFFKDRCDVVKFMGSGDHPAAAFWIPLSFRRTQSATPTSRLLQ